ncbi:MAG: hypothetical protein KatS3mg111_3375 [Pirellulaceae bacterium]|nr:MAG: hypothetical protein KatS3mg111_3375 [Pirellulaceae bacterium]
MDGGHAIAATSQLQMEAVRHRQQPTGEEFTPLAASHVLRARPELEIHLDQDLADDSVPAAARWIVFDPVTRRSARIGLELHWWLSRLDGRQPLPRLVAQFAQQAELPPEEAWQRANMALHQLLVAGWLCPTGSPAGNVVHELSGWGRMGGGIRSAATWLAASTRWVVFRVRGVNPDRWLATVAPYTNGIYSPSAVRRWCAVGVFTLMGLMLDFHRLVEQTTSLQWLMQPRQTLQLLVILLLTRAAHELGHAIVCKRWGCRCPDIGLFLVCGAPCVYCDVSESWRLPGRRGRAAVAAAGVYTEFLLAILAAWVWLLTTTGQANMIALQVMVVCSISTLAVNLNPLMRFDGYYLLADLLNVTNLRGRADAARDRLLQRLLCGMPAQPIFRNWREIGWAGLSVASWCYRATLAGALAMAIVVVAENWNMTWMGRGMAGALLLSWLGLPLITGAWNMVQRGTSWKQRLRASALLSVLGVAILWTPLPSRRVGLGWLQPLHTQGVYALSDGRLISYRVPDGKRVSRDQTLFRLHNPELELERLDRLRAVAQAEQRLQAARVRRDLYAEDVDMQRFEAELEAARALLQSTEQQLADLTIRVTREGDFYRALRQSHDASPMRAVHHRWGTSGDIGRWVRRGTLLGVIGEGGPVAVVPLRQKQLADIAVGIPVELTLQDRHEVCSGRVMHIGHVETISGVWRAAFSTLPGVGQGGATLGHHSSSPVAAQWAALCSVELPADVAAGSSVAVVFHTPPRSILRRLVAWFNANARFLAN